MIPAIITTCGERSEYLIDTFSQLSAAGFPTPYLKYDGIIDGEDTYPRIGIVPTFRLALNRVAHADRCCIFQDDILVAKGLHDWLVENPPPEGVVSLYTAAPHDGPDGWNRIELDPTPDDRHPWMHCLGACALMFDRETARKLLELPPPVRTDRLGAWIGEFCYHNDIPFWCHSPSLVQHIGEHSVRGGMPLSEERQAKRFCEDVSELA